MTSGQTVNVVFRGFNPQSSIYQWSTEPLADGEDPVCYLGPTLRLNVYEQDPYRWFLMFRASWGMH